MLWIQLHHIFQKLGWHIMGYSRILSRWSNNCRTLSMTIWTWRCIQESIWPFRWNGIHWILGTAIIHDTQNNSLLISQKNCIEDIATKLHSCITMSYKTVKVTLKCCGGCTVTQADRGENQREKSKVSPLLVSPYYTTLDCAQGYYSVCTDPALCGPLTHSGCMYVSYFTSMVTLEVNLEQSGVLT